MSNGMAQVRAVIPLMRHKINAFKGFSFLLDNNSSLIFSQFKVFKPLKWKSSCIRRPG